MNDEYRRDRSSGGYRKLSGMVQTWRVGPVNRSRYEQWRSEKLDSWHSWLMKKPGYRSADTSELTQDCNAGGDCIHDVISYCDIGIYVDDNFGHGPQRLVWLRRCHLTAEVAAVVDKAVDWRMSTPSPSLLNSTGACLTSYKMQRHQCFWRFCRGTPITLAVDKTHRFGCLYRGGVVETVCK